MSLDYIPVPASSSSAVQATGNVAPPQAKRQEPAAVASTLEVMADVHQRFDDIDSGEVEVLDSTQEGNQATQF